MQEMAFKIVKGRRIALRIQCFMQGHSLNTQYCLLDSRWNVSSPTQSLVKRGLPVGEVGLCMSSLPGIENHLFFCDLVPSV